MRNIQVQLHLLHGRQLREGYTIVSQLITRFGDRLLARLVPHNDAHAVQCSTREFWRFCYCSRGLKYGHKCTLKPFGNQCVVACPNAGWCGTVMGAC
jgi:hypothetical protein